MALTPSEYLRSDAVWFDDGNIVLETQGTIFRVYRGILANNSPIFADMFTLPPLPGVNEEYDGCPVVHMPDDARPLGVLLRALYESR